MSEPQVEDPDVSQRRPAWWGLILWAALVALAVWRPRGREFLIAIGLQTVVVAVHLAPSVAWGRLTGIRNLAVGIYIGKWVARITLLGLPVRLNFIPGGGYVKFAGNDDPPVWRHEETYNARPRWQRIAVNLAMPLATLALGAALIGPAAALDVFARGFEQFATGAFRGGGYRGEAIARLFTLIGEGRYVAALGVIAAKNAALNLFPLPTTNGGLALMEPLSLKPRAATMLQVIGFVLMLLLGLLPWGASLISYLFG
jgi:membrane-associated protease RseP (regulator of RpoE activity)